MILTYILADMLDNCLGWGVLLFYNRIQDYVFKVITISVQNTIGERVEPLLCHKI